MINNFLILNNKLTEEKKDNKKALYFRDRYVDDITVSNEFSFTTFLNIGLIAYMEY